MFTPPSASLLALLLLSFPPSLASPLTQRWVGEVVSDGSASSAVGAERAGAGGGLILVGEGAEQNGGLGLELGQSPGWVGWLSGWGWGEGEVTILVSPLVGLPLRLGIGRVLTDRSPSANPLYFTSIPTRPPPN